MDLIRIDLEDLNSYDAARIEAIQNTIDCYQILNDLIATDAYVVGGFALALLFGRIKNELINDLELWSTKSLLIVPSIFLPADVKVWFSKKFVENLLSKNPSERMNIKQVLDHPWIKNNMKNFGSKEKGDSFKLVVSSFD